MIKVHDIAYVRFAAPDLDEDAHLPGPISGSRSPKAATAPCSTARGTDPSPYLHVTEPGEAGLLAAIAFEAASAEDLAAAATTRRRFGCGEDRRTRMAARRSRFTDPDGFNVIEIVHGRETRFAAAGEAALHR